MNDLYTSLLFTSIIFLVVSYFLVHPESRLAKWGERKCGNNYSRFLMIWVFASAIPLVISTLLVIWSI